MEPGELVNGPVQGFQKRGVHGCQRLFELGICYFQGIQGDGPGIKPVGIVYQGFVTPGFYIIDKPQDIVVIGFGNPRPRSMISWTRARASVEGYSNCFMIFSNYGLL